MSGEFWIERIAFFVVLIGVHEFNICFPFQEAKHPAIWNAIQDTQLYRSSKVSTPKQLYAVAHSLVPCVLFYFLAYFS